VPDATWITEIAAFMEAAEFQGRAECRAAVFRPGLGTSRPLLVEVLALLRTTLQARPQASQGLLIEKRLYDRIGGHRAEPVEPERDLARRLGRHRIVVLRCGLLISR
jgi:hypothetical protein